MAENKTKPTEVRPADFIAAVENRTRRADAEVLVELMGDVAGEPAVMWGPSIIGFGRCRYTYESGRSGEMPRLGFSPRKAHLVLYCGCDFDGGADLINRLGKLKKSVGCLYIAKLADIDLAALRELLERSLAWSHERHPAEAVPA
jgi:hypothetical protein